MNYACLHTSMHTEQDMCARHSDRRHAVCRYVRPQFIDEDLPAELCIVQGRHPVLDVALDAPVVPNDTHLAAGAPCALVITGPNMGGKSCYIRQAALIAIMAQVCAVAELHSQPTCPMQLWHSLCSADKYCPVLGRRASSPRWRS